MDETRRLYALVQLLADKTQPTRSLEDAERRVYETEIEYLKLRCRALEGEIIRAERDHTQVVEKSAERRGSKFRSREWAARVIQRRWHQWSCAQDAREEIYNERVETITSDNELMLPQGLPLRQESVTERYFPEGDESVYNEFSQRQKTIDMDMLRCEIEKSGDFIASADEDIVDNTGSVFFGDEDQLLQRSNVRTVTETTSVSPTLEVPLLTSPMTASECFTVDEVPPRSTLEPIVRPKIRLFPFNSSLSKQSYDQKPAVILSNNSCKRKPMLFQESTQETDSVKSRIKSWWWKSKEDKGSLKLPSSSTSGKKNRFRSSSLLK